MLSDTTKTIHPFLLKKWDIDATDSYEGDQSEVEQKNSNKYPWDIWKCRRIYSGRRLKEPRMVPLRKLGLEFYLNIRNMVLPWSIWSDISDKESWTVHGTVGWEVVQNTTHVMAFYSLTARLLVSEHERAPMRYFQGVDLKVSVSTPICKEKVFHQVLKHVSGISTSLTNHLMVKQ